MIRPRRRAAPDDAIPVVLPRLVVTADGEQFTITLDGELVAGGPVARTELGRTLAAVVQDAGTPVRVDVHDVNGGVYSDIIQPPSDAGYVSPRSDQNGFAVHYRGFLPGEQVVIAVIDRSEVANANGVVTLSVTRELAGSGEVLLFGRVSGTTFVTGSP